MNSGRADHATGPMLIAVLVTLTALAPFAIDMYLAAFPMLARDFHASPSSVQLTLTAFLVGLACGQLLIGALSDRYGRRTPLIAGTVMCSAAGILCAVTPSIHVLMALRFVQGAGCAAGVVIARAVLVDRARGRQAAQLFATLNFASLLAPLVAPVLGGAVVTHWGWRAVFVVLAMVNVAALLGVVLFVDESLPVHRRRPGGLKALAASGCSVLANRKYLAYTTATALVAAAMFGYVAASPFVLQDIVGLTATAYSYTFASCSVAVAVGGAMARVTVKHVVPQTMLT